MQVDRSDREEEAQYRPGWTKTLYPSTVGEAGIRHCPSASLALFDKHAGRTYDCDPRERVLYQLKVNGEGFRRTYL
jgi:hypothetical protein